ncbi:MAG: NnrU family protein [Rhodospirillales bacterium]|nr:NnrU family protein [Rhodospirillales bacterium]
MTGGLWQLFWASLVFAGSHVLLSGVALRPCLIAKLGEKLFSGFYALIQIAAIVWMVRAFAAAPEIVLWDAHTAIKHLTMSFMILAFIMIAAGLMGPNPTLAGRGEGALVDGPRGMIRVTRHPMMWGIGLWALTHLAARGDGASLIFFGAMALLALGGSALIDYRKAEAHPQAWAEFEAQSSHIPFAAIIAGRTWFSAREIGWAPVLAGIVLYLGGLIAHEWLFGSAPISWVSGLFD